MCRWLNPDLMFIWACGTSVIVFDGTLEKSRNRFNRTTVTLNIFGKDFGLRRHYLFWSHFLPNWLCRLSPPLPKLGHINVVGLGERIKVGAFTFCSNGRGWRFPLSSTSCSIRFLHCCLYVFLKKYFYTENSSFPDLDSAIFILTIMFSSLSWLMYKVACEK